MTALLRLAFVLAMALVFSGRCAAAATRPTPADFADLAFEQKPGAQLPLDLVFRDEDGRATPLGRFFTGAPVLLVLEYMHCPTLCGLVLGNLVQETTNLPPASGRDFAVLAVSIDPRETPPDAVAARAQYRRRYPQADLSRWHFLTGSAEAIAELADAVGFHDRYDPAIDQYAHPAGFLAATGGGVVSSYLLGVEHSSQQVQLTLTAASSDVVAAPAARLLLLCFDFDPRSGRYTPLIEQIVFIACLLTVLTLATSIGVALWREHKTGGRA